MVRAEAAIALKKTQLERLKAANLEDRLRKSAPPERYAGGAHVLSRKEQRELDRAQGLVPFAAKLNGDLVKRIQDHAREKGLPLNEAVAELLQRALDKD
jgi:hypothetical protein